MRRANHASCIILLGLVWLLGTSNADARPLRDFVPWSVLLCRYPQAGTPPRDVSYYNDMLIRRGTGGLADYWHDISMNGIDLKGSVVRGWFTINRPLPGSSRSEHEQVIDFCKDAARIQGGYEVPSAHRLAVITYPEIDLFGGPNGAFFPHSTILGSLAHETSHVLGLNHSYSDDPKYKNASWSAIGEYDDEWDLMSWKHTFSTMSPRFGPASVGLNAFHVDRMGWLPRSRIFTFGNDGVKSGTFNLAALNIPETFGYFLIRVPFDPGDLNHYYTIEFRSKARWDKAIPRSIVLIHEVKKREDGTYYSYLLRERKTGRQPVSFLNANGVQIRVDKISEPTYQAVVSITSQWAGRLPHVYGANSCKQGFVWREADDRDWVCVTPNIRTQARQDNQLAPSRRIPTSDICLTGYVWRDAFPGDHVCVPPQTRTQARLDNAKANERLAYK